MTDRRPGYPVLGGGLIATALVIFGLVAMIASPLTGTDGGTVAVVRNGGWFDTKDVRQIIQPGSSPQFSGWWSTVHRYPSTQRNFKVSSAQSSDSNEVINVPSKDGVALGIEGTFYFDLTRDEKTLAEFDDKFGTRTYTPAGTEDAKEAWRDEAGWNAFLDFTIGNLVQNDLRREVIGYTCPELIASCALAQNGPGATSAVTTVSTDKITAIQEAVNSSLKQDLRDNLGNDYFVNVKFVLAKVTLPESVQSAINDAQASFAAVTKAQAGLQQAQIDAQANGVKQDGYNKCPTCADIDRLKALPPGLTTYAPGAAFAVGGR
jgi:hypothetical protein